MTLGQKLKNSLSCFPADTWLSQAFTAQSKITLAIAHLALSEIRPCSLAGRINGLSGEQGTCYYLSSWSQAAHSSHVSLLPLQPSESHLSSPKAGGILHGGRILQGQPGCSLACCPMQLMALCYTDEAVSKAHFSPLSSTQLSRGDKALCS